MIYDIYDYDPEPGELFNWVDEAEYWDGYSELLGYDEEPWCD